MNYDIYMLRVVALLLIVSWPLAAQSSRPLDKEDTGSLTMGHTHVTWPAPEALLRDLRSKDHSTRLKALTLLGVPDSYSTAADPKPVTPANVLEIDELELRYETLGDDSERQAIVGAVVEEAYVFGAVAIETGRGWERIANFSCWCKYQTGDFLAEDIQVKGEENGRELVLHANGGGTGLYVEDEDRYRIRYGELRPLLSFTREVTSCAWPETGHCDEERRWFYTGPKGGVLVESKFEIPENGSEADWRASDLGLRHAKVPSCIDYRWDDKAFRYVKSSEAHACRGTEVEKPN